MIGEPASSTHAPVDHSEYGENTHDDDAGNYEFQWHHLWNKVTTNANGTTGWATIIHSTNPAVLPNKIRRVHLCASDPCMARHKANKYGNYGPPIHLQHVVKQHKSSAVAEPSGSLHASAETAVAGPSGSLLASVETAVVEPSEASVPAAEPALVEPAPVGLVEPAPIEGPASIGAPLELEVHANMTKAPDCPKEASLQNMMPPDPTFPVDDIQVDSASTAAASTAAASTAVAAQNTINATLLSLARDIRRPRVYVGYSAFILMGLLKKCRPCVWEGSTFMDLVEVFAPGVAKLCSAPIPVAAIPVALVAQPGGSVDLVAISEKYPLTSTCHYVAGVSIPECHVVGDAGDFEAFYASLGVGVMASVMDGDCAFDVMTMMLGIPPSASARNDLRIEVSDYLIARIGEPWMHDVMAACQELRFEDVELYRSGDAEVTVSIVVPTAPAPAVAVLAAVQSLQPDQETFAAMRWVSKLDDDVCVLGLIRSLPTGVLEEQVSLYRRRDETAVAVVAESQKPKPKISIGSTSRFHTRMLVGQRFHLYCQTHGISTDKRMPYGAMKTFIRDNIRWTDKMKELQAKAVHGWYDTWRRSSSNQMVAAVAGKDEVPVVLLQRPKSALKSRAPVSRVVRRNAPGAGRPFKAYCIREALYEWFSGIRYAIDWKQLMADNRSRGRKHLARFPRSVLRLKAQQLLQDYTYVCLLNGVPVASVRFDSWWFKRWEEEHGLSMRKANRKYAVPRWLVKERMEIMWVVLFRIRLFNFFGVRLRCLDSKFRSVSVSSQRDREPEQTYLGG